MAAEEVGMKVAGVSEAKYKEAAVTQGLVWLRSERKILRKLKRQVFDEHGRQ